MMDYDVIHKGCLKPMLKKAVRIIRYKSIDKRIGKYSYRTQSQQVSMPSKQVMTKSKEWITVQKCQKCENQFTWKSMEKSLFWGYKPITCSRCHSTHYVSFWTRIILAGSITMIPLGLMFMIIIPFRIIPLSVEYWVAFYLIWAALVIGIAPFFARYKIRETKEDTRVQGE